MLTLENVSVAYSEAPVFAHLTTQIKPGVITGMIGPNGAGKSSLVKAILGLIKPQTGQIRYNERPLKQIQKRIAYVEQRKEIDLNFPINVLDVVLTGSYSRLGLFNNPNKNTRIAAQQALEKVGMSTVATRQISQLSGGQLQRVFVARAILQDAEVIILDEPFVGIDLQSERAIMEIIREWRDADKTILIIHHDLTKVSAYFDELLMMNHGLVAAGPTKEVYNTANIQKAFSSDLSAVLFNEGGQS